MKEEIDKVHIFKKTIWDESSQHNKDMRVKEENCLHNQLETYDKLFLDYDFSHNQMINNFQDAFKTKFIFSKSLSLKKAPPS